MRRTRQQVDEDLIDIAAGVFARYGFRQAPLQAIADAAGYSKAGLLNRFSSKEALQEAVVAQAMAQVAAVNVIADEHPAGRERDLAVVVALVDQAQRRPGDVALTLSAVSTTRDGEVAERLNPIVTGLFAAFSTVPKGDLERNVRVTAALGVLAVTTLALRDRPFHEIRSPIIATCCAALWAEQ
jgi:AcrR family transcriptional regulator